MAYSEESLALHPADEALREEIPRLRASLTALLLQKDELLLVQCPRIEAAYLRRFGALELKVYECFCGCLRAKRKAKLIRARQNRRERPDPTQIEAELDEELAVYRQELETRFQRVAGVLEKREGPGLTAKGTKELKELYRRAVKALHPDLHPEGEENQSRCLNQAMRAYRAGDIRTLRTICDSLEPAAETELNALEELEAEARRLRRSLRELDEELERVKTSYPFSARIYLEDPERGREKEAELTQQLQSLRERTEQYERAVARMLAPEEGEEAP